MFALELERVSHAFGTLRAVDDLSMVVEEGEIVCLLGPSGCGKTTVLRLAAGLEHLQTGRIGLSGEVVAGTLHSPDSGLTYRIDDGIANLLPPDLAAE